MAFLFYGWKVHFPPGIEIHLKYLTFVQLKTLLTVVQKFRQVTQKRKIIRRIFGLILLYLLLLFSYDFDEDAR